MTKGTKTYQWCIALLLCLVQTAGIAMYGQDRPRAAAKRQQKELADTLRKIPQIVPDSLDALTWNGKMYKDYMQAYKDASKGNWDASSITDLLPPGYIDRVSQTQIVETLRKRKDTYRRYRDLSIFAFIGVYLISVIDAYVDAELSNFDITPDLSMRIEPAVINNPYSSGTSNKSVGLQCSFRF